MLVANLNGYSVDALGAARGLEYRCPSCKHIIVLKQGRQVVHHFAHKPPISCDWAAGETRAHLSAKLLVRDALRARGLRAETEFVVDTLPGDRRADVMTWRAGDSRMVAFELQHSALAPELIEARANSYARAGIAQIWIPFLNGNTIGRADDRESGLFIERYSPRPFEKWIDGFCDKGGMWMYDPRTQLFWRGSFRAHRLYVQETTYFTEGGDEMTGGNFFRDSKRFRDLDLLGPFQFSQLRITIKHQLGRRAGTHWWSDGKVAHLVPAADAATS